MKSKLQSLYSNKEMQERDDSVNRLFLTVIHKHSFEGLGTDTLTSCELTPFVSFSQIFWTLTCAKSRVYPPLFHSSYFHTESTAFEKSLETCPFSWIPHCTYSIYGMSRLFESPRKKVDSVVATRIFSPNYFEYRLWFPTAWLYSPGGSTISWLDSSR